MAKLRYKWRTSQLYFYSDLIIFYLILPGYSYKMKKINKERSGKEMFSFIWRKVKKINFEMLIKCFCFMRIIFISKLNNKKNFLLNLKKYEINNSWKRNWFNFLKQNCLLLKVLFKKKKGKRLILFLYTHN